MELPEFNPASSGPQGQAGIPPERLQQGLRAAGVDLIGANMKPEDSAPAQEVLDQETTALAAQLGVTLPTAAPQAPVQPETPNAAPTPDQPAADPLAERVRKVREKYQGDFQELAKAYAHTDAARTQAQQERNSDMADLRRKLEQQEVQMRAMERLMYGTPQQPSAREAFERAPQPQAATPPTEQQPGGAEQFWQNPEANINRIVQQNLLAYEEAKERMRQQESFQRLQSERAGEIQQLKPLMAELYLKSPQVYDRLPQGEALDMLLERAKDRSAAMKAAQFYSDIAALDGGVNQVANPGPGIGSVPTGGTSARVASAPQTPNGDWGGTKAMGKLWKTGDGTIDEMRALLDVLKERGHGEHVSVF